MAMSIYSFAFLLRKLTDMGEANLDIYIRGYFPNKYLYR